MSAAGGWPNADPRVTLADREEIASRDTEPPPVDVSTADVLRRMLPKAARRADALSVAIASLYARGSDVERAFNSGGFAQAERRHLAKARRFVLRSLREFGCVVHILVEEMRACGQSTEFYQLGDVQRRVEQDAARFAAGLADRDGRGGRSGGPPMLRISDDYSALATTLRSYARDLESGLED